MMVRFAHASVILSMSTNDTTRQDGRLGRWLRTRFSTQAAGQQAEDLAGHLLERHGLHILARNYRCRGGEIDLIARDGKTLVFVEVRLRRNATYGGAGQSITPTKQRRIILAARHYLAEHNAEEEDCRFDCVLLTSTTGSDTEWLRDAFSAD